MKDFTNYDQALALRDLGFDEPCFAYYDNQRKELDTISSDVCERLCKYDTHIKAPTFSQAFRWFRNKHNFWVEIKVEDNVKLGEQTFYWSIFGEYKTLNEKSIIRCLTDSDVDGKTFKTYEESESSCLDKLIEIVKNISNQNKELLLEELNQLLNKYSDSPEDFMTDEGSTPMWEEREDHFWAICQKLPSWTDADEWYVDENCADPDLIIFKFIEHIKSN